MQRAFYNIVIHIVVLYYTYATCCFLFTVVSCFDLLLVQLLLLKLSSDLYQSYSCSTTTGPGRNTLVVVQLHVSLLCGKMNKLLVVVLWSLQHYKRPANSCSRKYALWSLMSIILGVVWVEF